MPPMSLDLKMNFLDEIAISLYQKLFTNALFGHTRLIKPLFLFTARRTLFCLQARRRLSSTCCHVNS